MSERHQVKAWEGCSLGVVFQKRCGIACVVALESTFSYVNGTVFEASSRRWIQRGTGGGRGRRGGCNESNQKTTCVHRLKENAQTLCKGVFMTTISETMVSETSTVCMKIRSVEKIKRSVKIHSLNNIDTESKEILIAGQLSKQNSKLSNHYQKKNTVNRTIPCDRNSMVEEKWRE